MMRFRFGGPGSGEPRDRGAAAVEMALVLPLLLLVLFAFVDFGRAYNMKIELTQAAREGVRVIALGGTNAEATDRAELVRPPDPSAPMTVTSTSCLPAGTDTGSLTVSVVFKYLTPLGPIANIVIGASTSTLPNAGETQTLTETGVMRCSG